MTDERTTVLLVDDEEDIRDILSIVLTDMGYDVLVVADGAAALSAFRESNPPIVLTDIKMPGMDGIELLREIKAENSDAEVVMITGHGDMDLAIKSLKYEATDFVTKPINDDILEIALKRAHERLTMRAQLRMYTENLERMVEEKTRKLVESERLAAVGQTAAGLAHAIKNISGGLSGGIYVMDKGFELDKPEYLRQGWKMVKGNVHKINNVAMELLNFARDREPDYRHVDPNAPLRDVFDLMEPQAEEYGIAFRMEPDENLPLVWLDPEAVHRALLNLATNAIYACADIRCSHRDTKIVLRSRRPDGWAVEYEVSDTGCGMDEETRKKVFRNFFTTKGYDGTGLGLMLTKKIVDAHGGVIELDTEKGKGARIRIRIPQRSGLKPATT
ncbi:MAG: sensor histidine kinase [Desulfococcaceae bacterium]